MELVGHADPAILERLRVRVDAAREHTVQTPSKLCLPAVHRPTPYLPPAPACPAKPRVHYGLARCAGDEDLLRVPRLARAEARAGNGAGRGRALPPVRARRASRTRPRCSPQPRARLVAGLGASSRRPGEERPRASRRVRRRFRDRARVAACGEPRGRRALDGRHGRHTAAPYRAFGAAAATARVHRHRAPRAPRATPVKADGTPLCACSVGVRRGDRIQRARGCGHRRVARAARPSVPVSFVPFGVDADALRSTRLPPSYDVVSVGADPHRDFELLLEVARTLPRSASRSSPRQRGRARSPTSLPTSPWRSTSRSSRCSNGSSVARAVALPVRENTYSGATTVLLQAMALEKPVVVSRTSAIATGYGLVDGENCRLVATGEAASFAEALGGILGDDVRARSLAACARQTVQRDLSWERYVGRLEEIVVGASKASPARS